MPWQRRGDGVARLGHSFQPLVDQGLEVSLAVSCPKVHAEGWSFFTPKDGWLAPCLERSHVGYREGLDTSQRDAADLFVEINADVPPAGGLWAGRPRSRRVCRSPEARGETEVILG
jgi:hypothetical protein